MPKTLITKGLLTIMLTLSVSFAQAEQIKIGVSQQGGQDSATDLPRTGMTMQGVQDKFGEPTQVTGPVGEPPITTWQYAGYTVYFEHDRVIHTVYNPS